MHGDPNATHVLMAPNRFFFPGALSPDSRIELPDELGHRLQRVLRLRNGAALVLFNGDGGEYQAVLRIDGRRCLADILSWHEREAELAGRITLAQGLPAGDKMDWIIEKAVELGVHRLVPIQAVRSIKQLDAARQSRRRLHWERIVQSASEQCGRNRLMQIDAVCSLADYFGTTDGNPDGQQVLCCDPDADRTLAQAVSDISAVRDSAIHLLVGPEGGWSETELELAQRHRAQAVRFGRRILRTETAGLALTAAVSALRGWE